jgi:hypothetical protein
MEQGVRVLEQFYNEVEKDFFDFFPILTNYVRKDK